MSWVFTERSEVPLVTLGLCVMRRYNLGEGTWYPQNTLFIISFGPMSTSILSSLDAYLVAHNVVYRM